MLREGFSGVSLNLQFQPVLLELFTRNRKIREAFKFEYFLVSTEPFPNKVTVIPGI